jgi:hypothetical protein
LISFLEQKDKGAVCPPRYRPERLERHSATERLAWVVAAECPRLTVREQVFAKDKKERPT